MAARQASYREQRAAHGSVAFDRFHGVLGTGRDKAAGARQHRRNESLVAPQRVVQHLLHHFRSAFVRPVALLLVAGCPGCITRARWAANRSPRETSFTKSAYAKVITERRGLKTTSTGPSISGHEFRTASRIRRRIRLRSTDSPTTLPTVNPTRGPSPWSPASTRRRKKTVIFPVNCRRPFWYTRWKSACFSRRFDLGNLLLAVEVTPGSCRLVRLLSFMATDGLAATPKSFRRLDLLCQAQKRCFTELNGHGLVAVTGADSDALASLGTTARQHRPPALGLHTRTKSVRLGTATTVGLKCALWHSKTALLTG
jgi:hypothetical protein